MMGEELDSAYLTERGLLGDRAYALVDQETGRVVSAKNPRKWAKLFYFCASYKKQPEIEGDLPPVNISLPDGRVISTDHDPGDTDRVLSEELGREVKLVSTGMERPSYEEYWPDIEGRPKRETITEEDMPPQTFFDGSVLHILTTSTLDQLKEFYPEGRFEPRRFRPNIVVEASAREKGFVENSWPGRSLMMGKEVLVKITGPCTRCVMTTLAQGDLPSDLGILRTAARHNQVRVGVYATIGKGGLTRRGDLVRPE